MKRRTFLGTVGAAALVRAGVSSAGSPTPATEAQQESADDIYRRGFAIDAICFSMEPPPLAFVRIEKIIGGNYARVFREVVG